MRLKKTQIGFVQLVSAGMADAGRARGLAEASQKYIRKQKGFELVATDPAADKTTTSIVSSRSDAEAAAGIFRNTPIDALIIQLGTFSPDALTMEIISHLNVPIALWAVPEPSPEDATPWCGSTTGLLMHTSTLTASGRRFSIIMGDPETEATRIALDSFLKAAAVRHTLRSCTIGLLAPGRPSFRGADYDQIEVKDLLGPTVATINPEALDERYDSVSEDQAKQEIARLEAAGWVNEVEDEQFLTQCARSWLAIKMLQEELGLDAISTAEPEAELPPSQAGICLAHAQLPASGVPADDGGDILGLLTVLVQHLLAGRPAVLLEWVEMDERNNQVSFRNRAGAPATLINPQLHPSLRRIGSGQDRVAVDLPMKGGHVCVARLIATRDGYRLLAARGRAVPTAQHVRGARVNVKFDYPVIDLFNTIIENGFPHRYSLVYQDVSTGLLALADMLDIGIIAV